MNVSSPTVVIDVKPKVLITNNTDNELFVDTNGCVVQLKAGATNALLNFKVLEFSMNRPWCWLGIFRKLKTNNLALFTHVKSTMDSWCQDYTTSLWLWGLSQPYLNISVWKIRKYYEIDNQGLFNWEFSPLLVFTISIWFQKELSLGITRKNNTDCDSSKLWSSAVELLTTSTNKTPTRPPTLTPGGFNLCEF